MKTSRAHDLIQMEEALQGIINGVALKTGQEFLESLTLEFANVFGMRYAFIGRIDPNSRKVETKASVADGMVTENFEYKLEGTPCEKVAAGDICCHPNNVQTLFPKDHLLKDKKVIGYIGVPLTINAGKPLGLIVVMHDQAVHDEEQTVSIIRTFINRTGRELERIESEERLRESEGKYKALIETTDTGYVIMDLNARVIDANSEYVRLTGHHNLEEILGRSVLEWTAPYHREFNAKGLRLLRVWGSVRPARHAEVDYISPDGTITNVEISGSLIQTSDGPRLMGLCRDITGRKRVEEELRHHAAFEAAVTSISTDFINLPTEKTDEGIDRALEIVAGLAGADRAYIFQLSQDEQTASRTHEWCAPEVPPRINYYQKIPVEQFSWFKDKMQRMEVVHVPRPSDLPDEAGVYKQVVEADGTKSSVDVPMIYRGKAIGFLGFDSVHYEKAWSDDTIVLLRIVGEILTSALERRRSEVNRKQMEREMEEHKRLFYRETILSVTQGKLEICDASEIRSHVKDAERRIDVMSAVDVSDARHLVYEYLQSCGLKGDRLDTFVIGVGEAITNAIKHGKNGRIYTGSTAESVWVCVTDKGSGIEALILPQAVLRRGFSTKPSLGLGYSIMLEASDHILLKTDRQGTSVLLERFLTPQAVEMSLENIVNVWEVA